MAFNPFDPFTFNPIMFPQGGVFGNMNNNQGGQGGMYGYGNPQIAQASIEGAAGTERALIAQRQAQYASEIQRAIAQINASGGRDIAQINATGGRDITGINVGGNRDVARINADSANTIADIQARAGMNNANTGANASMQNTNRVAASTDYGNTAGANAQMYGAGRQADASMYNTSTNAGSANYLGELGANAQMYGAGRQADASMYGAGRQADASMYNTSTNAGSANYLGELGANSSMANTAMNAGSADLRSYMDNLAQQNIANTGANASMSNNYNQYNTGREVAAMEAANRMAMQRERMAPGTRLLDSLMGQGGILAPGGIGNMFRDIGSSGIAPNWGGGGQSRNGYSGFRNLGSNQAARSGGLLAGMGR